jgi:hypothetical protein
MSPNQLPEKAGLVALNVARFAVAAVGEAALRVLPSGSTLDTATESQRAMDAADAAIAQLSCRVVVVTPLDTPEQ